MKNGSAKPRTCPFSSDETRFPRYSGCISHFVSSAPHTPTFKSASGSRALAVARQTCRSVSAWPNSWAKRYAQRAGVSKRRGCGGGRGLGDRAIEIPPPRGAAAGHRAAVAAQARLAVDDRPPEEHVHRRHVGRGGPLVDLLDQPPGPRPLGQRRVDPIHLLPVSAQPARIVAALLHAHESQPNVEDGQDL